MFVSQSRRDVHTDCAHCFGGTFCAGAGAANGACGSIAHAAWAGTTSKPATPNPRTPAQNRIMRPHVRLLVTTLRKHTERSTSRGLDLRRIGDHVTLCV